MYLIIWVIKRYYRSGIDKIFVKFLLKRKSIGKLKFVWRYMRMVGKLFYVNFKRLFRNKNKVYLL